MAAGGSRVTNDASRTTDASAMSWNEEAVINDDAEGLCARSSCLEDIMQLFVEPHPVGPVPQVGEVQLEMRVLDDAERVLKIVGTTRFEFEKYQVFRTAHPQGQSQKVQGSSSSQDRFFVGIRRKQEVKRNAGGGGVAQAKDSVSGHRIVFEPSRVGVKSVCDQRISYGRSGSLIGEHQQIDVLGRTDTTPGIHRQRTHHTIGGCRLRQRPDDPPQVDGQWTLLSRRHRGFADRNRRAQ